MIARNSQDAPGPDTLGVVIHLEIVRRLLRPWPEAQGHQAGQGEHTYTPAG